MPEEFKLRIWDSSETAKRTFGRLCQAVNENGGSVRLLGTAEEPLLVLADIDDHPEEPGDVTLGIDEAKSDWPAVTTAAAVFGTRFRIRGKARMRAVLFKSPDAQHPAERYRRSDSPDANRLAQQMEMLAKEVRKLGQKLARVIADRA